MQFTHNAHVYTIDRQPLGRITHVVLDPATKKVTHIVVHHGAIFTEGRVIPIHMFQSSCPGGVILRDDIDDLHSLPKFEESLYVEVDLPQDVEKVRLTGTMFGGLYLPYPPADPVQDASDVEKHLKTPIYRHVRSTQHNIPAGEVALKEGAWVMSADDHHVGNIESVLVNPQTDRVTNVVISKNALLMETRKMVPVSWIQSVYEDKVYLTVKADSVKELPNAA